jgi:5-(carboxyamino)imidazole ribonucleotide synthase
VIGPGAVIGILGGGQLGRMTAMAAARLGYRCHVLAPEAEAPAADVAAAWTRAEYGDEAALDRFAAAVDVATLEFENVPVAALERLARRVPVRPGPAVLAVTQDRVAEKDRLRAMGAPVTGYAPVGGPGDLERALAAFGGRGVLKTTRLGYDGKGQLLLGGTGGLSPEEALERLGGPPLILEAFVDFALELSVVTARGVDGRQASYPAVENRHERHILATTTAPARVAPEVAAEAVALAERIAAGLDVVGLLAAEMFLTRDGRLLVNDLACKRADPPAAQLGPLDDRRLRGEPVRAAGARGLRAAAGRPGAVRGGRDGEPDRRGGRRALAGAPGRARRAAAPLRQGRGPAGAEDGPRHPAGRVAPGPGQAMMSGMLSLSRCAMRSLSASFCFFSRWSSTWFWCPSAESWAIRSSSARCAARSVTSRVSISRRVGSSLMRFLQRVVNEGNTRGPGAQQRRGRPAAGEAAPCSA